MQLGEAWGFTQREGRHKSRVGVIKYNSTDGEGADMHSLYSREMGLVSFGGSILHL